MFEFFKSKAQKVEEAQNARFLAGLEAGKGMRYFPPEKPGPTTYYYEDGRTVQDPRWENCGYTVHYDFDGNYISYHQPICPRFKYKGSAPGIPCTCK